MGAFVVGWAIHISNGFHSWGAIRLIIVALLLSWAALLFPRSLGRIVPDRPVFSVAVLLAGLTVQLASLSTAPFAQYAARPMPRDHVWFLPSLAVAAVAAAGAASGVRRLRVVCLALLILAHLTLGVITFRASPDPAIDVVTVHRAAFAALERGESPYSVTFPDIYKGRPGFYPPGAVKDGVVQFGYPYPMGSLLMTWSGHVVAGDFRYAELAALALGAVAIACAGRLTSVAVLAAGLLLFTPRVFFELEQAWVEPLLVFWLGVALWAWRARRLRLTMSAIALLVTVKQYLILAVPLAYLLPKVGGSDRTSGPASAARIFLSRARAPAAVALIVAALFAPMLLWDFTGFIRSVVLVQLNEALQPHALSLAVAYARRMGHEMPVAVYAAIVVVALGVAGWRAPRTPAGYAAALAVVLFTAFAFGKKAFCNYYFFVIAVLCASIAVAAGARDTHRAEGLADAGEGDTAG